MLTVAGIDGSTKKTGIAIMTDGQLIDYVLLDLHKEKDVIKRIQNMLSLICERLDKYKLDAIYMEKAFNKSNVDTTIKLANLAGGVMLYCTQNGIKFDHPLPSQWRAKIGIEQSSKVKRNALKAQAIKAVKNEYGIDVNDDIAESILLARSAFDLSKIEITEDDLWEV